MNLQPTQSGRFFVIFVKKGIMKKIRIGKDIALTWTILTNGENVSLEGRDLKLILTSPLNRESELKFETSGNVLTTTINGVSQRGVGVYNLTLWENYGKIGQTALDACNSFCLVRTTCEEGDEDESLKTETVSLSGDIEVFSAKDYNMLDNKPRINDVELKGNRTLNELGIQPKGNYATKEQLPTKTSQLSNDSGFISAIPDNYVTEEELEEKGYATKQEIPDTSGFIKTVDANQKYQPKGEYLTAIPDEYVTSTELTETLGGYATKEGLSGKADSTAIADMATKTWVGEQGFLTEHQDISNLATKQEVTEGLAEKQPKGDYALKSELPDTSRLATKTELSAKLDADTYNSEKENFATKTELGNKANKVGTENVSETTKDLTPGKYYIFGEVETLTLTLAAAEENVLADIHNYT